MHLWMPGNRALYYCCAHRITDPFRQLSGMNNSILKHTDSRGHAALVVLLKAPANAKRRLASEVGDLAGEAAAHLWACALEDAFAWPGPTWMSPAEPRDREWLVAELESEADTTRTRSLSAVAAGTARDAQVHLGHICGLVTQQGANLGERINYVDHELRRQGATELLFVGTDCPGLDSAYLEQAAARLDGADAVVGPAADGGVVLMGARRPWPDLGRLGWSTVAFREELVNLCRGLGWSVATLEDREDIDTLSDLLGAATVLSGDKRPARQGLARWLSAQRGALLAAGSDPRA